MIVELYKHQLRYFRTKSRRSNVECYAILIGKRVAPNLVRVEEFFYPKLEVQTANEVVVDEDSYQLADQCAKNDGLIILGGIHSHIEYPSVLSKTDLLSHKNNNDKISGIVSVINKKTHVSFWELSSPLPCTIQYIK